MKFMRIPRWFVVAVALVISALVRPPPAFAGDASLADGVHPLRASVAEWEQAQGRFSRGKSLYEAGSYAEALEELARARAIVASPNIRLYRARAFRELDQLLEAYHEFGRTVIEAMELVDSDARYQLTAEAATAERAELARRIGFLGLSIHNASPATEVILDGKTLRRGAWTEPVPVLPGVVTLKLRTRGVSDQERSVRVEAGQTVEITLDARSGAARSEAAPVGKGRDPAKSEAGSGPGVLFWTALGVGAAGISSFAVFGTLAASTHRDLERTCAETGCLGGERDRIDTGRKQQLIANVGLGVGLLGIAGATTLYLVGRSSDAELQVGLRGTRIVVEGTL